MMQPIDLDILRLDAGQRAAAEAALALEPQAPTDENGAARPLAALADLLRRLPWLRAQYAAHGIGDDVLADTLSDVSIWMNRCRAQTGAYGMRQYGWLLHHFSFELFRLGRLQFIRQLSGVPARAFRGPQGEVVTLALDGARFTPAGEADGTNDLHAPNAWTAAYAETPDSVTGAVIGREGLATGAIATLPRGEWQPILVPGDPVLEIHIPEGEPLAPAAVGDSLAAAPAFFADHLGQADARAFTCESWLLDWALPHIQPGSNVALFQQRFHCVPIAGGDGQTMERVYGFDETAPSLTEGSSRLQRAIYAWYAQGNRCRGAYGYIPI